MMGTTNYRPLKLRTDFGMFMIEQDSIGFALYCDALKIGTYGYDAMAKIEAEEMLEARGAPKDVLEKASNLANWEY